MTLRIAIGAISHETNTFCRDLTGLDAFREREWLEGPEILQHHRGTRSYIGGMLAAAERMGVQVLPTFSASATPSGTIAGEAFGALLGRLLEGLDQAGSFDAVCLALHGAGVAEGEDDIEGTILAAVREQVGRDIPLVATLDLHGNLTPAMVDHADALFGVHEYPHVDSYERGMEAVECAAAMAAGRVRPVMHLERLPMMIPTTTTFEGIGREMKEFCRELERRPRMMDCAWFHGFSHTDVPVVCTSVLAMADGDATAARAAARETAGALWAARESFRVNHPGADEAVRLALQETGRPVVINDTSDNPGGGGPGDATHLLGALLASGVGGDACFGFIYDPETVAQAHEAGTGATIAVRLGGKYDDLHGRPVEAQAYVKALTDGRFVLQTPMGRGRQVDLGRMARLVLEDVDVLVASVRSQTLDAEVFLLHGIDVTRRRLVALKSSNHFRAGFQDLAARIITADTPGLTTCNLQVLPYRRLQRPIWPLDAEVTYPIHSSPRP